MTLLVIEAQAEQELAAIDAWWRANRPRAPDLFVEEFAEATEMLQALPELGRPYPAAGVPGVRRLLLRGSRFHVYYAFDGAAVSILAIHSAVRGRGPEL